VDWIHVAEVRDQWFALVNTEMNLPFPYVRNFLISQVTISLSGGLCSMELVS
jgi:hypothetical protein